MRLFCLALATSALMMAQPGPEGDPPGRVGRISYIGGVVSFQPAGVDDWVPAPLNRPLVTGDRLWVEPNGRAEVHIGGAAVRLNSKTAFEFLDLDDRMAQIRLSEGAIEVRLRELEPGQIFEIDTPNMAFTLLRPGIYRIDAYPDSQTTLVTVRNGEGDVSGAGQVYPVRTRDQARISGDQQIQFDIVGAPRPDWFDDWCDGRDRRDDRSISARYVPRGMIGYQDLDDAGDWRPDPNYGQVWYPRAVPANWAPYRFGHWAWIEPWGWTWVDDAPWGFAPFHYGRWAYISGGWGWVPGPAAARPVYAPALVAFVGGPRFSASISFGGGGVGLAWFPLGPREAYVPAYRVSPAYVNRVNNTTIINNTTIVNNNVTFINQNAPNAVTAVRRDAFVGGRSVGREAVAVQPQVIAQAQVVRTAEVAPTRESVLGRSVVAASVARPPDAAIRRTVVSRTAAPPAPIPFAQREQVLRQNPGRPLEATQVQQIRSQAPVMRQNVNVMPSAAAPTQVYRPRQGEGPGNTQRPVPSPAAPAQPRIDNSPRPADRPNNETRPVPAPAPVDRNREMERVPAQPRIDNAPRPEAVPVQPRVERARPEAAPVQPRVERARPEAVPVQPHVEPATRPEQPAARPNPEQRVRPTPTEGRAREAAKEEKKKEEKKDEKK